MRKSYEAPHASVVASLSALTQSRYGGDRDYDHEYPNHGGMS